MKLFKRKRKISRGRKYLIKLSNAIKLRKKQNEMYKRFHLILEKADNVGSFKYENYLQYMLNIKKAQDIKDKKTTKIVENNPELIKLINENKSLEQDQGFKFKKTFNQILLASTNKQAKIDTLPLPKKPSKFRMWFRNFKFKIKNTILLIGELVREIKYWSIAEYKIIEKLFNALSNKKDEIKVRKAFINNRKFFIDKYGYDKGMNYYFVFSSKINRSVKLNKRMLDMGM